jgi:hypothetical protein
MDNITIIFCNFNHIGDTHFAQPFVKNIINNNPNNQYYIFNNYNTYCYLDQINNLKDIESHSNLKVIVFRMLNLDIHNNSRDKYNFSEKTNICTPPEFKSNFLTKYDNEFKILLINTWIGPLIGLYPIIECNLISYHKCYNMLINDINNLYDLNIKYNNNFEIINLLPFINKMYIEHFSNIKNSTNKKIVFYYNYLAKSGQSLPINTENEHNLVIKHLSLKYIVIIPYKSIELQDYIKENNVSSIIFGDDLININEFYSCKNLYSYAQMAYDSDISIYFDNGRSFLYINSNFIIEKNNNLRLHFANDRRYYDLLNDEKLVEKDFVKYVEVNNYSDIINYFSENFLV